MLLWFLLRFRRLVPSQLFFCRQLRCHKVHRAPDDPLRLVIQSTGPSLGQLMATLPFAGSPFRAQMPCCAAATLRSMFHGGATCETQATATGSGGAKGTPRLMRRLSTHSNALRIALLLVLFITRVSCSQHPVPHKAPPWSSVCAANTRSHSSALRRMSRAR